MMSTAATEFNVKTTALLGMQSATLSVNGSCEQECYTYATTKQNQRSLSHDD